MVTVRASCQVINTNKTLGRKFSVKAALVCFIRKCWMTSSDLEAFLNLYFPLIPFTEFSKHLKRSIKLFPELKSLDIGALDYYTATFRVHASGIKNEWRSCFKAFLSTKLLRFRNAEKIIQAVSPLYIYTRSPITPDHHAAESWLRYTTGQTCGTDTAPVLTSSSVRFSVCTCWCTLSSAWPIPPASIHPAWNTAARTLWRS